MVATSADPRLVSEDRLLSFAIASSDMWYSEIGQREIYLRREPQRGLYLQGEIPECGPDCYANLSEVLLEYCCGCEQCGGHTGTASLVCPFADRLGRQLMAKLHDLVPEAPDIDRVSAIMDIILSSMDVAFEKVLTADGLRYDLAAPPIRKAASGSRLSGLYQWGTLAQRAFVALSSFVVGAAAPGWVFVPPSEPETNVLWIIPMSSESQP